MISFDLLYHYSEGEEVGQDIRPLIKYTLKIYLASLLANTTQEFIWTTYTSLLTEVLPSCRFAKTRSLLAVRFAYCCLAFVFNNFLGQSIKNIIIIHLHLSELLFQNIPSI